MKKMHSTEDIARGAKDSNAAGTGAPDSSNKTFVFKYVNPPGGLIVAADLMHWEMLANCLMTVSHSVGLHRNEGERRLFHLFLGCLLKNLSDNM